MCPFVIMFCLPLCQLTYHLSFSRLTQHCNPNTDPYKPGVDLNPSGCSNEGLLDFFQDYWNAERGTVHRDVAELFSGTGLECDPDGSCTIGCAFVGETCDNLSRSYGVNWVSEYTCPRGYCPS